MSLIALISEHSLKNPYKPALIYGNVQISYHELLHRAKKLANYLANHGVNKEPIGFRLNYSPQIIVCVLASLLLACPFVPIDPCYPLERIDYLIAECKLRYLITEQFLDFYAEGLHVLGIEDSEECEELSTIPTRKESLAYILFTSGSTGKPKGVEVYERSLLNQFYAWQDSYALTQADIHLQLANLAFDVFYGDVFRSLCSGATLVLCPRQYLLKPKFLFELIESEQITFIEFVPTTLRLFANYLNKKNLVPSSLRLLVCGSDNWSVGEYKKIKQVCKTRLINSYGLTEATIDSCYFELSPDNEPYVNNSDSVHIGKPFKNTKIYLLDQSMTPVIDGEIGEIYIAGSGLAKGYVNNTALTRQKFVEHYVDGKRIRLLKTGDLGKYLPDHNIQFVGRIDNQVKILGRRIELSDIENNLNLHPDISDSFVKLIDKENCHEHLVAYLVSSSDRQLSSKELRKFLAGYLPYYMIPSHFFYVDQLPLTPNGKIDRRHSTLPAP